jgi:hypothetical protein
MLFVAMIAAAPSAAQGRGADETELLRLHAELIAAHQTNDVERWMAVEASEIVSANGGVVGFLDYERRRQQRARYLAATTFHTYQDVRDPIVRVSRDGTLGWVMAEVEVRGETGEATSREEFHDVWAWVELYQKIEGHWRLVGNVSNRRPGGGAF